MRLSAPLGQILSTDVLAVINVELCTAPAGTTLHSNAGSSRENLFQRLTRILIYFRRVSARFSSERHRPSAHNLVNN